MVYFPAMVVVGQYFDKRRGMAMGLSTAGAGLGCIAIPPLYEIMFESFGYEGTFIVMSAVLLNCLVCALLYRPLQESWRGIKGSNTIVNKSENISHIEDGKETTSQLNEVIPPVHSARRKSAPPLCDKTKLESVQLQRNGMRFNDAQFSSDANITPLNPVMWSKNSAENALKQNAGACDVDSYQGHNNQLKIKRRFSESHLAHDQTSHQQLSISDGEKQPLLKKSSKSSNISKKNSCFSTLDSYLGLSLLTNPAFTCFVIALGLGTMAYLSAQNLIIAHGIAIGISEHLSVFILSIIGIADMTGRLISGFLYDISCIRRIRKSLFVVVLLSSGVSIIGWSYCTGFAELATLSFMNGFINGAMVTGRPVMVGDLVATEDLSPAFGMTVFSQGIFILIGPLIAGELKDLTGTYEMSFIFAGSCSCLAAVIYLVGNWLGTEPRCCRK